MGSCFCVFGEDKWAFREQVGSKTVCDNVCLCRHEWPVLFQGVKLPQWRSRAVSLSEDCLYSGKRISEGSLVHQLVRCPALDFSSGHDLRVLGSSHHQASPYHRGVCLWFPVALPLPLLPYLSKIKQNNHLELSRWKVSDFYIYHFLRDRYMLPCSLSSACFWAGTEDFPFLWFIVPLIHYLPTTLHLPISGNCK